MTRQNETWEAKFCKIVESARESFGNNGRTDAECLALTVSCLLGYRDERISTLNLNAQQAQQIARLHTENDRLRKLLTEIKS